MKIREAATLKKDNEMLLATEGQDLIAKEFMMHRKCFKDYTRICSKRPSNASYIDHHNENETKSNNLYSFVRHHVIGCMQTASMKLLTDIYGYDGDDTRLRNKVKKKLEEKFPRELLFVSVSYHQPMLVISQKVKYDAIQQA